MSDQDHGEDSDSSDESVHEMKLSKDFYQGSISSKPLFPVEEEEGDDDVFPEDARDVPEGGAGIRPQPSGPPGAMSMADKLALLRQQYPQKSSSSYTSSGSGSTSERDSPKGGQSFFSLPMTFAEKMAQQQRPSTSSQSSGERMAQQQRKERRSSSSRSSVSVPGDMDVTAESMSAAQGSPIAEEEEQFPYFKDDHFAAVHPEYDEPEIAQIFGEETGVPGPGDTSKSVKEDVRLLRQLGFIIDYTRSGFIGEGFYGAVYRGYYAPSVQGIQDIRALQPFAVKVIDFAQDDISDDESYQSTGMDTLERRECFETEKWILSSIYHKNLVSARQVINMGETRQFHFLDDPDHYFLSPDRIYIIMDYADGGEFERWFPKHQKGMEPYERLSLIRQLFAGLLYLHNMGIIHGDIHTGNILMYFINGQWVPKWSDFGLGFVDNNKQFRYKVGQGKLSWRDRAKMDIFHLAEVMKKILLGRRLAQPARQTAEEKKTMDDLMNLCNHIIKTKPSDINQIFTENRHLLEEALDIHEDFF